MSQEERADLATSLQVLEDIRRRTLAMIERGAGARKRPLRERVTIAVRALGAALEDVERWVGP